jgi:hypothetical protein
VVAGDADHARVLDLEYKYSATQDNGQITAMKDWTSGEELNYAHDEQAV